MAVNTMDAIKKKMQAMKLEKENAFDKADQLEQKLNEQKTVFEQVGPEKQLSNITYIAFFSRPTRDEKHIYNTH